MSKYTIDDLNEKQREFVERFVARGGGRECATDVMMEVYGYDRRTASATATRTLKNEKIKAVLQDMTVSSFAPLAVLANEKLYDIIATGTWYGQPVKPSDGLKAIKEVLDRGIGAVASKSELEITDNRSINEVKEAVLAKLSNLSEEDRRLFASKLGEAAIDAEYVEIDPAAPWGRTKDGVAKQKPGMKPVEKRVLPGPDAYKPPVKTELQRIKDSIKERKLREVRKLVDMREVPSETA